jgi:NNP family nitrate/nitrite transporter-like MFS transporter
LKLFSFLRLHMRASHGSWICCFLHVSRCLQFAMCPLLPEIAMSLHLTKSNMWLTNIYIMVGGIPVRLVLGLLCDQYGARILITHMLVGGGHSLFVYRSHHQSTWVSVLKVLLLLWYVGFVLKCIPTF